MICRVQEALAVEVDDLVVGGQGHALRQRDGRAAGDGDDARLVDEAEEVALGRGATIPRPISRLSARSGCM